MILRVQRVEALLRAAREQGEFNSSTGWWSVIVRVASNTWGPELKWVHVRKLGGGVERGGEWGKDALK